MSEYTQEDLARDEMAEEVLQDEAKQLEALNKKNQKQQAQPLTKINLELDYLDQLVMTS